MSFFGDLERLASDLYPYRWPITIALAIVAGAALWFAYRRGWHRIVARHKVASAIVAAAVLAAAVPAGNYFLSPLWERSHLDEPSPLVEAAGLDATATPGDPATPPLQDGPAAPAFEPRVTHQGAFSGADDFHFGRGHALLIEMAPGRYTLRVEDFSVRNGPDLFVYLTPDEDSVHGAINLGDLKATDGAFNYEVPPGTDVSRYTHAIVWCRQFAVLFASAPLEPAPG